MYLRPCVIIFILISNLYAQKPSQLHLESIEWQKEKSSKVILPFKGAALDYKYGRLPIYQKCILLDKKKKIRFEIIESEFEQINLPLSKKEDSVIGAKLNIKTEYGLSNGKYYAIISFIPIIKGAFDIKRFTSFKYKYEYTSEPLIGNNAHSYKTESPLASGNWYKIAVKQNGVYKLTKSFFDSLDINTSNLIPSQIRLFGQRGGMLPEANNDFRYDGLQELAVVVEGESDGTFDSNDKVLFYGEGPDRIYKKNTENRFYHSKHLYDDYNYYFLNINQENGLRINTLNQSSQSATHFCVSFDEMQFHQLEQFNFLKSGRTWFGESFEFNNTQNFSFNFPNRSENDTVYVKSSVVARSTSGSNYFYTTLNGNNILSQSIGSTGVEYTSEYAKSKSATHEGIHSGQNINLNISFSKGNSSASGWLSYLEVQARRQLIMHGNQMSFRDLKSSGNGFITEFKLSNGNGMGIWDISNPIIPRSVNYSSSSNDAVFTLATDSLKEFLAFNTQGYLEPINGVSINNQNLHSLENVELVIISAPEFLSEAERLKDIHVTNDNLNTVVVEQSTIFNEFSSGKADISAIRDFLKMLYDRANSNGGIAPKYLQIMGDGSYDYKGIGNTENTNFVLSYQSPNSLNPINSLVSDDFYGMLDDNEGANIFSSSNLLDIGIGRIPVKTLSEARAVVDKIESYLSSEALGSWRNELCFIADDEDYNIHINDANTLSNSVANDNPYINLDKIFFDAYTQVSVPGGERYPDVQKAINDKMFQGTMIMNYTGHGGELGWAHERVLNITDVNAWTNNTKLPLFMTATCEFSRFDDPERTSAGELVLLNPNGGAIGLMTTVRLVYSSANQNLAENFYATVFDSIGNDMPTLGEIVMKTKNNAWAGENNRKFTLLGDPALKLPYPKHRVSTLTINGDSVNGLNDTLKALSKVNICGYVHDQNGNKLDQFNGTVYPSIYDKSSNITTLANDPSSNPKTFNLQKSLIYKGKASVINGDFCFEFIVPKDINYSFGSGRISYYAENGEEDATGFYKDFIIGGTASNFEEDKEGPEIEVYLNDENFVFGGLTNENPLLFVKLEDKSGINTVGNSIGHDLTALLDENTQDIINLNQYYEADLDNYQKGIVQYPMQNIEEGRHQIKIKAWDVFNNSNEAFTEFIVAKNAQLALNNILNYPNPFVNNTFFQFEHNKAGSLLDVKIQIFTISGRLIKTIDQAIATTGFRVNDIRWDGLDDYGDPIGRGVYIYRLYVQDESLSHAEAYEKLVILR